MHAKVLIWMMNQLWMQEIWSNFTTKNKRNKTKIETTKSTSKKLDLNIKLDDNTF